MANDAHTEDKAVAFQADGRRIEAKPGQTIGAALWARGDRALSRSMKYHRPRGWSCGTGRCNDCLMRVNGKPNIKTCVTPAEADMVVEGQNAWPSVRHDIFRANDIAFWRGLDHHTSFVRPHFLYPLFTKVMRQFAGWGTLPDDVPPPPEAEALRPDVLVVGGGPAGMAAASAAARAGAHVVLMEESGHLGGAAARMARKLSDPDAEDDAPDNQAANIVAAHALVARWRDELAGLDRVELRLHTALAATYQNGLMIAHAPGLVTALRPHATVIATGGYAAQASFANNDLPGIMSASGASALLHGNGVRPGRRAVVYGAGTQGCHVALDLMDAGIDVAAIVEPNNRAPAAPDMLASLESAGMTPRTETHIVKAHGWGKVRGVTVEGPAGRTRLRTDLIVTALGQKTAPEAFQAMGCTLRYLAEAGGAVPVLDDTLQTSVPGLFAAGDAAGIGSLATARASGHLAGVAAAAYVGHSGDDLDNARRRLLQLQGLHGGPIFGSANATTFGVNTTNSGHSAARPRTGTVEASA